MKKCCLVLSCSTQEVQSVQAERLIEQSRQGSGEAEMDPNLNKYARLHTSVTVKQGCPFFFHYAGVRPYQPNQQPPKVCHVQVHQSSFQLPSVNCPDLPLSSFTIYQTVFAGAHLQCPCLRCQLCVLSDYWSTELCCVVSLVSNSGPHLVTLIPV